MARWQCDSLRYHDIQYHLVDCVIYDVRYSSKYTHLETKSI